MGLRLEDLSKGYLVGKLRARRVPQGWIQVATALSGFLLLILTGFLEPWKVEASRSWMIWAWSTIPSLFFGLLTFAMAALDRAYAEADKVQIETLQRELKISTSQRDSWIQTAAVVRELIQSKQARLLDARGDRARLLAEFKNSVQPVLILKSVYDRFKQQTGFIGKRLRVSVFSKVDPSEAGVDFPHLRPLFSFDGRETNFLKIAPEHFRLDSDTEQKAEVVRHFSGEDHTFRIIEDCCAEPSFTHFRPEEKKLLQSMLLFKHRMESVDSSIVLALDCDVPCFFKRSMEEDYEAFIVEMMHRLEYELVVLQLVNDALEAENKT